MFLLHIEEFAEREILHAAEWYDDRSHGLGLRFTTEVRLLLGLIEQSPLRFPKVEGSVRRAHLRRFPYSLLYYVLADRIVVIACYHDARDPEPFIEIRT